MEEMMKKLALWHTRTFRPVITHEDLEPIMTSLGFVPLHVSKSSTLADASSAKTNGTKVVEWKEYAFTGASAGASASRNKTTKIETTTNVTVVESNGHDHLPRPRLPYPRIDGLHLLTYRAFIDAVGFYLGVHRVADHFHVRGMPLHRIHDRVFDKVFRRMNDERRIGEDEGIFVFREGTLDQATMSFCNSNSVTSNNSSNGNGNGNGSGSSNPNPICLVPLKDIIVLKDIAV